jgi:hypothetical protein
MRSRAKRLAVSTMMVRTPLPSIRASMAADPVRVVQCGLECGTGSPGLHRK